MGNGNPEEVFQVQFLNASRWGIGADGGIYSSDRMYCNYLSCFWALRVNGCFHTRHSDADVMCVSLDGQFPIANDTVAGTSPFIDLTNFNSKGAADTYPSWSSNGKWLMCSSRRADGNYSRLHFSYFNHDKAEKAFLLPQEDPEQNTYRLKCYNRLEFMVEPVRISIDEFSKVFR